MTDCHGNKNNITNVVDWFELSNIRQVEAYSAPELRRRMDSEETKFCQANCGGLGETKIRLHV